MGLARNWLGGILRASGATLLVPFGLVMAVAVAATVGGSPQGVGSLGQLFEGPGIPPAAQAPPPGLTARESGGVRFSQLVPAVPVRRAARRDVLPATEPTSAPTPARRQPAERTRKPRVVAVKPPREQTGATPPPAPAPPPARPPSLVRRVGNDVAQIVRRVPVVGPPAADAVDTVIDLLEPPPPAGTARATPPAASRQLPQVGGALTHPR
jgi:hypothetical protein